jgi:hypothetical protein
MGVGGEFMVRKKLDFGALGFGLTAFEVRRRQGHLLPAAAPQIELPGCRDERDSRRKDLVRVVRSPKLNLGSLSY